MCINVLVGPSFSEYYIIINLRELQKEGERRPGRRSLSARLPTVYPAPLMMPMGRPPDLYEQRLARDLADAHGGDIFRSRYVFKDHCYIEVQWGHRAYAPFSSSSSFKNDWFNMITFRQSGIILHICLLLKSYNIIGRK